MEASSRNVSMTRLTADSSFSALSALLMAVGGRMSRTKTKILSRAESLKKKPKDGEKGAGNAERLSAPDPHVHRTRLFPGVHYQ